MIRGAKAAGETTRHEQRAPLRVLVPERHEQQHRRREQVTEREDLTDERPRPELWR